MAIPNGNSYDDIDAEIDYSDIEAKWAKSDLASLKYVLNEI